MVHRHGSERPVRLQRGAGRGELLWRSDPAVFALLVDAKDDAAVAFYRHLGFMAFADRPMTLFLPLATALKALR